jgi:hypothetical protein
VNEQGLWKPAGIKAIIKEAKKDKDGFIKASIKRIEKSLAGNFPGKQNKAVLLTSSLKLQ